MSSSPDSKAAPTETQSQSAQTASSAKGWRFWVIFVALCLSIFLTALDLASVSTVLPTVIHDLDGTDSFVWVSSAYTLTSTAILPMSGRLADIFGRRVVLLSAIFLFAVGSAIAGWATSMDMLIAGRAVQGLGSGAIQVLVAIVTADLIPLKERGFYQSLTGATFSLASVVGPFIGGALAERASWRWLFWLNLPLCAAAASVVALFLRLRKPPVESFVSAFFAMDWIGNAILIASATSCTVGLTWAGIQYPWSSVQVLAPIILGLVGLPIAVLYDAYFASHPIIPTTIINNRTSIAGYIGSFLHGLVINSVPFYLPTYFQAAKIATPFLSGLYILPAALSLSPSGIVQGIIISKTGRYRLINVVGWSAMLVGLGCLTLLTENTPIAVTIPIQIVAAVGFGFLFATTFTVLAPLDPVNNSAALSFLTFVRNFASSWSISISATILQNRLAALLPPAFIARIPPGHDISYSAIPLIPTLQQPLQAEVRRAFSDALRLVWWVLLAVCAVGFVSVALQEQVALHTKMDNRYGMKEKTAQDAVSKAEEGGASGNGPSLSLVPDEKAEVGLQAPAQNGVRGRVSVEVAPVVRLAPLSGSE